MKKLWIALGYSLIFVIASCKKQSVNNPAYAQAYTRFVFIDAPGQGRVQFYLDGKINGNGDSSINNTNGTPYQPDNSTATTTLVNIASGGWTDNSPVNFSGTYGYNYAQDSAYAYFPNPTDRIPLAPIIGPINYYNWASLPATNHELTLYSVIPASLYGNPTNVKGDQFLDQQISLEGGAIQTYFVVNQDPCKFFLAAGLNLSTGLPIYSVTETVNYYSNNFGLVSVKDHPNNLPAFKDSTAYIRFMNLTPNYSDQTLNANTATVDVYIAPLFGTNPDVYSSYEEGFSNSIDSIGAETLVVKGLNRYQSTVDAPFYPVDVSANMRNNNTGPNDSLNYLLGKPRVPRYYRVLVYASGRSAANGDNPLAIGDWLAVYSQFLAYDHTSTLPDEYPIGLELDSWLLRSDGTNYHPAICTIPIAVSDEPVYGYTNTNWLSFRSCINYVPAGINNVYFGH